jgi:hypothetical protein
MSLERWTRALRDAWEHDPAAAATLALKLRQSPSPFARVVTRDLSVTFSDAEEKLLVGPRSLQPVRALDAPARHVMLFEQLSYRSDVAADGTQWLSRMRVLFGDKERSDAALPEFALGFYQPQVFGALKPRLIVPRTEDLRLRIVMQGNGGRLCVSVSARLEPEALMVAAGLVEPEHAGREGRL